MYYDGNTSVLLSRNLIAELLLVLEYCCIGTFKNNGAAYLFHHWRLVTEVLLLACLNNTLGLIAQTAWAITEIALLYVKHAFLRITHASSASTVDETLKPGLRCRFPSLSYSTLKRAWLRIVLITWSSLNVNTDLLHARTHAHTLWPCIDSEESEECWGQREKMGFPLSEEGGTECAEPDKISPGPPPFHSCHPHNVSRNVILLFSFKSVAHLTESPRKG